MTLAHRRAAGPLTAALLLAAALTACAGESDDGAGAPPSPATSEETSDTDDPDDTEPSEPTEEESEAPPEETGDYEPTDEVTPPGTRLGIDEVALVPLPYFPRGVGKYAVTVDSIERKPLRLLDEAGYERIDGLTDLYFVRQTYELVNEGNAPVQGTNLINHSATLLDGEETVDVNADLRGCTFGFFRTDAEVGDRESVCVPYLLPRGETIDEVVWYRFDTKYDGLLDGDYIYWEVEG